MMFSPNKKKGPKSKKPVFNGKIRLRVGDVVRVLAGRDRNKEGAITRILPSSGKVVIEGINIVIKHQKARPTSNMSAAAAQQQGGRIEIASPLPICKVQLVDKGDRKSVTRIGIKVDANNNRIRYAKKSGGVLDNE
jgi:large subunit ribosomal protein L24